MNFLRTLFSKAATAFNRHPDIAVAEPATTSIATGAPVCLTDADEEDEDPRTRHGADIVAIDTFRQESIPWQLC